MAANRASSMIFLDDMHPMMPPFNTADQVVSPEPSSLPHVVVMETAPVANVEKPASKSKFAALKTMKLSEARGHLSTAAQHSRGTKGDPQVETLSTSLEQCEIESTPSTKPRLFSRNKPKGPSDDQLLTLTSSISEWLSHDAFQERSTPAQTPETAVTTSGSKSRRMNEFLAELRRLFEAYEVAVDANSDVKGGKRIAFSMLDVLVDRALQVVPLEPREVEMIKKRLPLIKVAIQGMGKKGKGGKGAL